jgi:uncharacterized linocin/CFP29 family protein
VNHLLRSLAPITARGWEMLEQEAQRQLEAALASRRLVDFAGPHGWDHSATNLGRTEAVGDAPGMGVSARRRVVLPVVEHRVPFTVSRSELADIDRGAEDPDLEALGEAARRMALAENAAVFGGIAEASPHTPIALGDDMEACPTHAARAVEVLLRSGVSGPYGIALGPAVYTAVIETTEHGGFPLLEHLRQILGGPFVWAPGVDGAVVLGLRGGDFLFDCGQDLAIGYDGHDGEAVSLYLVESFTFRVATPEAAVTLPALART